MAFVSQKAVLSLVTCVTGSVTHVTKKVHFVIHKISSVGQHLKCFNNLTVISPQYYTFVY